MKQMTALDAVPAAATRFGLTDKTWKLIGFVALVAAACTVPFFASNYRLFQFSLILLTANAVLGINMLTGFNGQISLGHGAFYAIGAYTTAILVTQFGIPYWATIPIAGALCLIAGFLFGLPALRLEGIYLALATLALGITVPQFLKYKHIEQWTGGVQGIVLTKPEAPFGLKLNSDQWLYYFTLFFTVILFVLAWNLLRGRVGRAIVAIRDQPIAANAMGINTAMYKSLTFGVSALYTGIAGALSAVVVAFVAPDSFTPVSFNLLIAGVLGGIASISGAIYGSAIVLLVPNVAEQVSKAAPGAVFGVVLILFMLVMPAGLAGFLRLTWAWVRQRAGGHRTGS